MKKRHTLSNQQKTKCFYGYLYYIFYMGQNATTKKWFANNSKDYFQEQIEIYRWRADPITNTHICRVFFQLEDTLHDKEMLANLLSVKFCGVDHIPVNDIMKLATKKVHNPSSGELMSFENYVCTLNHLQERLNLSEVLYTLFTLLSGYQSLLLKFGRCQISPTCCFITPQGQLRAWISQDFKSNQVQQKQGGQNGIKMLNSSEMTIIKNILQIGQSLASNPTEYLHFSRHFRSFMERNILQNWNFLNARKLINSYIYTYKIFLSSNLKQSLNKVTRVKSYESQITSSLQSQFSIIEEEKSFSKLQQARIQRLQHNLSKKSSQRPLSQSDYVKSSNSMESNVQCSLKDHSKKISSIDLRSINRSKVYESPKTSMMALKSKELICQGKRQVTTPVTDVNTDRNYTPIASRQQSKLYNFSTCQGFSPNTTSLINNENIYFSNNKLNNKESQSGLKSNKDVKQKRKLQKKAANITKYISFFEPIQSINQNKQNKKQGEQLIECSVNNRIGCLNSGVPFKNFQNQMPQHNIKSRNGQTKNCKVSHNDKISFENDQNSVSNNEKFQGMSELIMHNSNDNTSQKFRLCNTSKTISKLISNKQVFQNQSIGSFMSIQQSKSSEYNGILCKMARSIDFNAQLPRQSKKAAITKTINRSINC